MIYFRTVKTPKTNAGMAALSCKKRGQKMAKEGSGRCNAQTEKYPSPILNRDQKYDYL